MEQEKRTWRINRLKNKLTPDALLEAYERLGSCKAAGRELGCDGGTIKRYMLDWGLEVKSQTRYSCNERFFESAGERGLYWAGFMAADGCAKTRKSSSGATRFQIAIGLSKRDMKHIEQFREDIGSNHKIHIIAVKNSSRNAKWNDSYKSEITIESKTIFDSLACYNIVPRKSLIYTFPEWLIDHPLVNHFMRGYFDGDGSWFVPKGKPGREPQLYFSLRGTPPFLAVYRSLLEKHCCLPEREKPIRINNGIGVLEYGGNGVCKRIGEFLYRDATRYLERKHQMYVQVSD